jgi:hypothetical protein
VRVPKPVETSDLGISGLDATLHPGIAGVPQMVIADNYLERIAKYVPAEVIAFSMVINAVLDQAMKTGGKAAMMAGFPVTTIAGGALIAGLIFTPIFVWYVREEGDAWITNAFVSTLAFPFWAYAMGAVAFSDFRDGNLAAILLATFTVCSGLISPRMPRLRKAKERTQAAPKEGPRLVDTPAETEPAFGGMSVGLSR